MNSRITKSRDERKRKNDASVRSRENENKARGNKENIGIKLVLNKKI
jgi:hypothetical protein